MLETFLGASFLAFVHLFASLLRFLDVIPRSRWLSIAGGVAVAYAFAHLLPELQEHGRVLQAAAGGDKSAMAAERWVWLMALLGLVIFYGLEGAARREARRAHEQQEEGSTPAMFWLHIASYGTYNALIGYLLVREYQGGQAMLIFLVGIGLHFVVNDHGLRQHHKVRYHRYGRWLLSGAILAGWAVGVSTEIHEAITAATTAFLAGGILLNTFKEELPAERESRFWAFALGAGAYAAILLAM